MGATAACGMRSDRIRHRLHGMTLSTSIRIAIFSAALLAVRAPLGAQGYPPSQRTRIAQDVALTRIDLVYGRPVARGRALFGALVPWDSLWHPGADSASRITVNHDVIVGGQPLAKGTYSLWLIPRASAPWTFILSRNAYVDHKNYPGPSRDALRFDVRPDSLSHMESMGIYFPMVLRDEATMRIQWGFSGIAIPVKAPYKPE